MTDRELMQQALEALEECTAYTSSESWSPFMTRECEAAITALRDRLAQPEEEPVAWMYHGIRHDDTPHERPSLIWKPEYMDVMSAEKGAKATPLYTTPRQWQGLTDDEREQFRQWAHPDIIEAIELKLKEKNT